MLVGIPIVPDPGRRRRPVARLDRLASDYGGAEDAAAVHGRRLCNELRTPVSVVRTAAEVTLERPHRDEAEYREALTMAGAQARRLGTLVEDMLVLARADAGGYPLRPVDLHWMNWSTNAGVAVAAVLAHGARGDRSDLDRPARDADCAATRSCCAACSSISCRTRCSTRRRAGRCQWT